MFLVLIAVTCRTWPQILGFPGFWFSGRESHEMPAYFLAWPKKSRFYGQAYLKTLALTGLTRLLQVTLTWQARPRPWKAWLGRACHAFDRAPDARVGGGGGGVRVWCGDLTLFKTLSSNSLPTGKSFQSNAQIFPSP